MKYKNLKFLFLQKKKKKKKKKMMHTSNIEKAIKNENEKFCRMYIWKLF